MALPKRIVVTAEGKKSLRKLSKEAQRRILNKVVEYNVKPELIAAHVKQLTDSTPPMTRLRIADFSGIGRMVGNEFHLDIFLDRKDL